MKHSLPLWALLATLSAPAFGNLESAELRMRKNVIAGARSIFSGQYGAGGEFFTASIKETRNPKLYTLILLTARLTGDHASALKLCMNNPAPPQRDHTFHYWCGRTYFDQGFPKNGYKLVKNAISLGGSLPHYLATAAYMAAKTGHAAEGEKFLSALVRRDPWLLSSWLFPDFLTGIIFTVEEIFSNFKYKGSLAENLAVFAWKARHPDLADYFLNQAVKQYGSKIPESVSELQVNIVKVFGDPARTRTALDKALRRHPASVPLLFMKADFLRSQRKLVDARLLLERLVKLDPTSIPILTDLGILNLETGRTRSGHTYLSYAKARNAAHSAFYYGWGLYWQRSGKFDKARGFFRKAHELEPTSERYLSAWLALVGSLGDRKAIAKGRARLKTLQAFEAAQNKMKTTYHRRFFKLLEARNALVKGTTVSWPAVCGLQCRTFKIWTSLRKGLKVSTAGLLTSLAAVDLLTPDVPLNGVRQKLTLGTDKPLLIYHFFYSTRPSLFK